MDNMGEPFDDFQLSQGDVELAEIAELLHNQPALFDDDIDDSFNTAEIEVAKVAELFATNPDIFEVSVH